MNRNTFAARRGVLSSAPPRPGDPVEHDDPDDVELEDEAPDPAPELVDADRPRRRKRTTKPKE